MSSTQKNYHLQVLLLIVLVYELSSPRVSLSNLSLAGKIELSEEKSVDT